MLPMKQVIGLKVIENWLNINNPKKCNQRHHLHVFWKWNYWSRSGIEFIDIHPNDVLDVTLSMGHGKAVKMNSARYDITSDANDLWPRSFNMVDIGHSGTQQRGLDISRKT